jgi:hypothetical protein
MNAPSDIVTVADHQDAESVGSSAVGAAPKWSMNKLLNFRCSRRTSVHSLYSLALHVTSMSAVEKLSVDHGKSFCQQYADHHCRHEEPRFAAEASNSRRPYIQFVYKKKEAAQERCLP